VGATRLERGGWGRSMKVEKRREGGDGPCLETRPPLKGRPWKAEVIKDRTQAAISGRLLLGIARMAPPNVRVIVRVPGNRPDDARLDPPRVEWNQDKEKVLWEVIARSRATDNGGTDWPALAAHLQVPLPYLLYRAQTRYEEDLRGLQGIKVADPTAASPSPDHLTARPTPVSRLSTQITSTRLTTPLGLRARLNSLTPATPKVSSSSIMTLQDAPPTRILRRPSVRSRSSSAGSDSDADSELDASEQAERQLEEQEALDKKLRNLQTMITGEKLGLVRSPRPRQRAERPSRDPHRALSNYTSLDSSSPGTSSVGSPQNSIPSIPSPPSEQRQVRRPTGRHTVAAKPSSPPSLPSRLAHPQGFGGPIGIAPRNSEKDSNNGSSTSSFSDLSGQSLVPRLSSFRSTPPQTPVSLLLPWRASMLHALRSLQVPLDCSSTPPTLAFSTLTSIGFSRTTLARDSLRRGSRAFHR
jgi:hypothetical protein